MTENTQHATAQRHDEAGMTHVIEAEGLTNELVHDKALGHADADPLSSAGSLTRVDASTAIRRGYRAPRRKRFGRTQALAGVDISPRWRPGAARTAGPPG